MRQTPCSLNIILFNIYINNNRNNNNNNIYNNVNDYSDRMSSQ